MKNPVTKTLVTLAVSMATSTLAFSALNAAEGDTSLTGLGKARQIVVQENKSKDKIAQLDKEPISQNIVIVDKDEKKEERKNRIKIIDKDPVEEQVEEESPIIEKQVEKTPDVIDEDVFAPQIEKKVEKKKSSIPMPTIFTEKQQELFNELSAADQVKLVRKLIKRYGYDTLYPQKYASNRYDDHYSDYQPKYYKKRRHSYKRSYNYDNDYSYSSNYSYNNHSSYGCKR